MFERIKLGAAKRLTREQQPAGSPIASNVATVFAKDEELSRQTANYLTRLKAGEYDFVDLGTCDGGGFTIAERLGGKKGLGFDLEPSVVRQALARGMDVALFDVCDLKTEGACVSFAVCSHVLEHLPGLPDIQRVLGSMSNLCRDYVIISGPLFEHEEYLLGLHIKALHSLMLDHTCKMKVSELQAILHALGRRDYVIALTERLQNSSNHWFYSANQMVPPEGLWTYDPNKHVKKPKLNFDRVIHRDFVCVVPLNGRVRVNEVLDKFYWGYDKVVVKSTWVY